MKFKDKSTGAVVDITNKVVLPLYEKSNNFTKVKDRSQKADTETSQDKE